MNKSLEDFIHQKGRYKGRLKQSELQTGEVRGSFKYRDKHPFVPGIAFAAYSSDNGEVWSYLHHLRQPIKENKKATDGEKIIKNKMRLEDFVYQNGQHKGKLKQSVLQTGSPKGSFRRGDEHPVVEGIMFRGYDNKTGESWLLPSRLEEILAYEAKYRTKNRQKIKRKKEKFLFKIQHIYDWQTTEQGKAKIASEKRESNNRRQRVRLKDPAKKAIQYNRNKKYRLENVEKLQDYRKKKNTKKRKQRTKALNQFYLTHDIPGYLWHDDEFANEPDLQTALEHVIVKRLGLEVERWKFLEEIGIPDIFIPKLDLIVEVKLLSSMWRTDDVVEQSLRYMDISPTVIVSLDGKPSDWSEKTFTWMAEKKLSWDELRTKEPPWFNPSELFDFLLVMKARL